MSRLDSFIARMQAQRDCLNFLKPAIDALPGPILEVGLGNGRTYDHLRDLFPGRDIYVFERKVAAHPDCIPADDRLFLGDADQSIPRAARQLGA
ncbi:MAG: class I SAM-dependent methyltransferase, partial [Proteobacteria bacterium]|nr:class I SAM-dependent methyltransferase [Pseudomonadota bacterium]